MADGAEYHYQEEYHQEEYHQEEYHQVEYQQEEYHQVEYHQHYYNSEENPGYQEPTVEQKTEETNFSSNLSIQFQSQDDNGGQGQQQQQQQEQYQYIPYGNDQNQGQDQWQYQDQYQGQGDQVQQAQQGPPPQQGVQPYTRPAAAQITYAVASASDSGSESDSASEQSDSDNEKKSKKSKDKGKKKKSKDKGEKQQYGTAVGGLEAQYPNSEMQGLSLQGGQEQYAGPPANENEQRGLSQTDASRFYPPSFEQVQSLISSAADIYGYAPAPGANAYGGEPVAEKPKEKKKKKKDKKDEEIDHKGSQYLGTVPGGVPVQLPPGAGYVQRGTAETYQVHPALGAYGYGAAPVHGEDKEPDEKKKDKEKKKKDKVKSTAAGPQVQYPGTQAPNIYAPGGVPSTYGEELVEGKGNDKVKNIDGSTHFPAGYHAPGPLGVRGYQTASGGEVVKDKHKKEKKAKEYGTDIAAQSLPHVPDAGAVEVYGSSASAGPAVDVYGFGASVPQDRQGALVASSYVGGVPGHQPPPEVYGFDASGPRTALGTIQPTVKEAKPEVVGAGELKYEELQGTKSRDGVELEDQQKILSQTAHQQQIVDSPVPPAFPEHGYGTLKPGGASAEAAANVPVVSHPFPVGQSHRSEPVIEGLSKEGEAKEALIAHVLGALSPPKGYHPPPVGFPFGPLGEQPPHGATHGSTVQEPSRVPAQDEGQEKTARDVKKKNYPQEAALPALGVHPPQPPTFAPYDSQAGHSSSLADPGEPIKKKKEKKDKSKDGAKHEVSAGVYGPPHPEYPGPHGALPQPPPTAHGSAGGPDFPAAGQAAPHRGGHESVPNYPGYGTQASEHVKDGRRNGGTAPPPVTQYAQAQLPTGQPAYHPGTATGHSGSTQFYGSAAGVHEADQGGHPQVAYVGDTGKKEKKEKKKKELPAQGNPPYVEAPPLTQAGYPPTRPMYGGSAPAAGGGLTPSYASSAGVHQAHPSQHAPGGAPHEAHVEADKEKKEKKKKEAPPYGQPQYVGAPAPNQPGYPPTRPMYSGSAPSDAGGFTPSYAPSAGVHQVASHQYDQGGAPQGVYVSDAGKEEKKKKKKEATAYGNPQYVGGPTPNQPGYLPTQPMYGGGTVPTDAGGHFQQQYDQGGAPQGVYVSEAGKEEKKKKKKEAAAYGNPQYVGGPTPNQPGYLPTQPRYGGGTVPTDAGGHLQQQYGYDVVPPPQGGKKEKKDKERNKSAEQAYVHPQQHTGPQPSAYGAGQAYGAAGYGPSGHTVPQNPSPQGHLPQGLQTSAPHGWHGQDGQQLRQTQTVPGRQRLPNSIPGVGQPGAHGEVRQGQQVQASGLQHGHSIPPGHSMQPASGHPPDIWTSPEEQAARLRSSNTQAYLNPHRPQTAPQYGRPATPPQFGNQGMNRHQTLPQHGQQSAPSVQAYRGQAAAPSPQMYNQPQGAQAYNNNRVGTLPGYDRSNGTGPAVTGQNRPPLTYAGSRPEQAQRYSGNQQQLQQQLGYGGSGEQVGYQGSQQQLGYGGSGEQVGYQGSQQQLGYGGSGEQVGFQGSQQQLQQQLGYGGSGEQVGYQGSQQQLQQGQGFDGGQQAQSRYGGTGQSGFVRGGQQANPYGQQQQQMQADQQGQGQGQGLLGSLGSALIGGIFGIQQPQQVPARGGMYRGSSQAQYQRQPQQPQQPQQQQYQEQEYQQQQQGNYELQQQQHVDNNYYDEQQYGQSSYNNQNYNDYGYNDYGSSSYSQTTVSYEFGFVE